MGICQISLKAVETIAGWMGVEELAYLRRGSVIHCIYCEEIGTSNILLRDLRCIGMLMDEGKFVRAYDKQLVVALKGSIAQQRQVLVENSTNNSSKQEYTWTLSVMDFRC